MNQMSMKQIRSTLMCTLDMSTVDFIEKMFDKKIISDYSDDGWILFKNEWIPVEIFKERYQKNEYNV